MIAYIIKSGLCLVLILLIYKVFLARERMYVFNRYYLLFGLCFSLLVPFVTMETIVEAPVLENLNPVNTNHLPVFDPAVPTESLPNGIPAWVYATVSLYILGYLLFFFRFTRNIYRIFYKIIKSVRVRYKTASLVLLKENVLPHTFLHYIFLKKDAYDTQGIAEELYTHELAHVSQKHSLDIILIELIQIVFWFNPLLIYYKKAMQLNHEFLADDAVIKSNTQIPAYQHLLLENAHWNNNLHLASNLNFSVTKKRLQMMTKHTTRVRAWFIATLTIPIFIGALFLFSTKVVAQETKTEIKEVSNTKKILKEVQDPKADYYKNATFIFEDSKGNKVTKTYTQLNVKERARLIPPPSTPKINRPNKKQLNDWGSKANYAIWIDGKVTNNTEISKNDIVYYTQSFVYKNARSKRFPQSYQVSLYTKSGFNTLVKDLASPLSKDAVLHFKEGKHNSARLKKKKVGAIQNSVRHELAQINKLPINYVNEKNGPNEMEVPLKKKTAKKIERKDIVIHITKEGKFSVNHKRKSNFKNLDKNIKLELKGILHKRARNSIIIYHEDYKQFIAKVTSLLKANKIYDIETINIADLPPPPPPPKKPIAIEVKNVSPAGNVSEEKARAIGIMHKIIKGQKLETMMINGKKHYYVLKNGRKYIFNEDSRMVDKNGKLLPPPPPPAKKKPMVKEIKVKNELRNKEKSKTKEAKNKKKVLPKVIQVKEVSKKN